MSARSASLNVVQQRLVPSDIPRKTMRLPYTLIACLNQNNELLMVKRNRPPFVGFWNLIGGKIDVGETPTSAAIREIHEEANIQAAQNRLRFRGIAIWPDSTDGSMYTGMFLFAFQSKMRETVAKQFGLLHEGVTAWINLDLLLKPSDYIPVPNFELLVSYMLETNKPPMMICHEEYNNTVRALWTCPVAGTVATRPYAGLAFDGSDLVEGT
jgi:8-oxo-dGTP diphosphatase